MRQFSKEGFRHTKKKRNRSFHPRTLLLPVRIRRNDYGGDLRQMRHLYSDFRNILIRES